MNLTFMIWNSEGYVNHPTIDLELMSRESFQTHTLPLLSTF